MYAANQIGVATTLPHSTEAMHGQQNMSENIENDHGHPMHSQDERFTHREANVASSEVNKTLICFFISRDLKENYCQI